MEKTQMLNEKKKLSLPQLGFLGVGWIGRNRMEAISKSSLADVTYIADSSTESLLEAKNLSPNSRLVYSYDDLLNSGIDGVVIATPSALHAEQSIKALEKGIAVFCQKPLGRNAAETAEVVNTAKRYNRLLNIDLSYRYTEAFIKMTQLINSGEIGEIFSVDLVFHNAYGPGKSWFYDAKLSGGGCVIDLGIHLIDMALFALKFPEALSVTSKIYSGGRLIRTPGEIVEDYATALIEFDNEVSVNLSCSWNLSAGQTASIEIVFHGTAGGLAIKNQDGSYYNFTLDLYKGTSTTRLCSPPDNWGGRAAINWVKKLNINNNFDNEAEQYIMVAKVLDKIYGRF